jgi:hypothetical protein
MVVAEEYNPAFPEVACEAWDCSADCSVLFTGSELC